MSPPAGMSLTKLFLAGNNWGRENRKHFCTVYYSPITPRHKWKEESPTLRALTWYSISSAAEVTLTRSVSDQGFTGGSLTPMASSLTHKGRPKAYLHVETIQ